MFEVNTLMHAHEVNSLLVNKKVICQGVEGAES